MSAALLLIRHTEVARDWHRRCYGASDPGLSRAGAAQARLLAPDLARWRPELVIHSGLRRAAVLARWIARHGAVEAIADPAWRERDFGAWEGVTWNAIYRATGNAMDGMVDAPDVFRPGGGETTCALADRVVAARAALPARRIAIVTHGGVIAALRGRHAAIPVSGWPALVPPLGGAVEM
ncbi:histidine phosphatase family protein [Polymorphobacter fuscus]|uniref:Histidine phosphatase family protein n=1 Tax=Sandarakinorhabdus fusca TaxID=1439888 RepID=A0A7C9GMK7_9SPHN|nr:histidine phosphatase family protein [Polymorphobacter fuscus]KAB7648549.1 histidine phosphatase family protein [Polymorphobacter fuscus]MQT16092.1 histidine phosphatase family protein [Polymorphobacter fuscus]NJC07629.1 broad specificity phosphatase PhoE [Polymorphobacter fuscus]